MSYRARYSFHASLFKFFLCHIAMGFARLPKIELVGEKLLDPRIH